MKEAGLTHGGFYAQFASRIALRVEALEQAGTEGAARIAQGFVRGRAGGSGALRAVVEGYLSERHLAGAKNGCPVAALASEMARQAPEVRQAAARRIRSLIGTIQNALPPNAAAESAAAITSQLVGALQLARTLGDNAEGKALLAATRRALLAQYDRSAAV